MNPNAQLLVAALRSGKYKQGIGRLVRITDNGKEHCCLGVACELYIEAGNKLDAQPHELDQNVLAFGEALAVAGLPTEVRDWLGFSDSLGGYRLTGMLAGDNDNGKTFTEIADIIESQPEGLFKS
jgi:hypothetical protein